MANKATCKSVLKTQEESLHKDNAINGAKHKSHWNTQLKTVHKDHSRNVYTIIWLVWGEYTTQMQ